MLFQVRIFSQVWGKISQGYTFLEWFYKQEMLSNVSEFTTPSSPLLKLDGESQLSLQQNIWTNEKKLNKSHGLDWSLN